MKGLLLIKGKVFLQRNFDWYHLHVILIWRDSRFKSLSRNTFLLKVSSFFKTNIWNFVYHDGTDSKGYFKAAPVPGVFIKCVKNYYFVRVCLTCPSLICSAVRQKIGRQIVFLVKRNEKPPGNSDISHKYF